MRQGPPNASRRTRRNGAVVLAGLLPFLAALDGPSLATSPEIHADRPGVEARQDPAVLEEVSGNGQIGAPGETLEEPLVVRVLDEEGEPYPGHPVAFSTAPGPGTPELSDSETVTDADGEASTGVTLDEGASDGDTFEILAEAEDDLSGSPVAFSVTVEVAEEEPEPTVLQMVSGDGQAAEVGQGLDDPFVVEVLDQEGDPYAGHTVAFAITLEPGDGAALSAHTAETGADGEAFTHLTLGDEPGLHEVEAEAEGALEGSPQTFAAMAEEEEPEPSEMELVSGDGQSAPVGEELGAPLVVRVLDQNGEPYAGHFISFEITHPPGGAHGAFLSTTSTVTGADGQASTELTLGTEPGPYEVTAQATGPLDGSPVIFTATAEGLDPAQLVFEQQPPGGLPGAPLSPAPAVRVEDEAGEPVTEPVPVTLSLASDGSPGGDATLGGTLTVETQDGVAVFDNVTVDRPGEDYTLQASAADLPPVESTPFDIRAPSLAVALEVSDPDPRVGETVQVEVAVANQEGVEVSGVAVSVELPGTRVDVVEEEASQGSFSAAQEVWDVGALGPGGQAHLSLAVVVRAVEPGELQ